MKPITLVFASHIPMTYHESACLVSAGEAKVVEVGGAELDVADAGAARREVHAHLLLTEVLKTDVLYTVKSIFNRWSFNFVFFVNRAIHEDHNKIYFFTLGILHII